MSRVKALTSFAWPPGSAHLSVEGGVEVELEGATESDLRDLRDSVEGEGAWLYHASRPGARSLLCFDTMGGKFVVSAGRARFSGEAARGSHPRASKSLEL
jgi:hypothetical protein